MQIKIILARKGCWHFYYGGAINPATTFCPQFNMFNHRLVETSSKKVGYQTGSEVYLLHMEGWMEIVIKTKKLDSEKILGLCWALAILVLLRPVSQSFSVAFNSYTSCDPNQLTHTLAAFSMPSLSISAAWRMAACFLSCSCFL